MMPGADDYDVKARTRWSNMPLADSRGFKILNTFDRASRPTIIESAVESADSAVKSADSIADSSADSVKRKRKANSKPIFPLLFFY